MTRETASCLPCKKGKFEGLLPDLKAWGSEGLRQSPALGRLWGWRSNLPKLWLPVSIRLAGSEGGEGKGQVGGEERESQSLAVPGCLSSQCSRLPSGVQDGQRERAARKLQRRSSGSDGVLEGPLDSPSFAKCNTTELTGFCSKRDGWGLLEATLDTAPAPALGAL